MPDSIQASSRVPKRNPAQKDDLSGLLLWGRTGYWAFSTSLQKQCAYEVQSVDLTKLGASCLISELQLGSQDPQICKSSTSGLKKQQELTKNDLGLELTSPAAKSVKKACCKAYLISSGGRKGAQKPECDTFVDHTLPWVLGRSAR